MKTSIVIFKMFSLCAFFFLVSCEKSEPLQIASGEIVGNTDRPNDGDPNGDRDPNHVDRECPVSEDWSGKFVTEAINIGFDVQIVQVAYGVDGGDWQFIRDNGDVLNKGDLMINAFDGTNIHMYMYEDPALEGYYLVGTVDPDCHEMNGDVFRNQVKIGSFSLSK